MSDRHDPLDEQAMTELAGALLTSSTLERYVHSLASSRHVRDLNSEFSRSTADSGRRFVNLAWSHWSRLLVSPERDEWEVPLAAIIYLTGRSGAPGVDALLRAVALSVAPQAVWVAALARRMLMTRSGSQEFSTSKDDGHVGSLGAQFRNDGGSQQRALMKAA